MKLLTLLAALAAPITAQQWSPTPATSLAGGCSQHGPFIVEHRAPLLVVSDSIRVRPVNPAPTLTPPATLGVAFLTWGNTVPNLPLTALGCSCSLMTNLSDFVLSLEGAWGPSVPTSPRASVLLYPSAAAGLTISVQPLLIEFEGPNGMFSPSVPTPGSCLAGGVHFTAGEAFWVVLP